MENIQIDDTLGVPKYRQIINSIYQAISNGDLKVGDKIPSLNQICAEFDLSRDTVMVAFNELKAKGVINSIPGKGYYINSTDINLDERIFLLFDELNAFKEDLYTALLNSLDIKSNVDIYFHHFNFQLFKDLIHQSVGKYTSYVIMPATFDHTADIIAALPEDKVYILDRLKDDLKAFPVVYQDFEGDVYRALQDGEDLLAKYDKLVMVFPGGKEPEGRMIGFQKFCEERNIPFEILRSLLSRKIRKGEAYFVPSDRNLVRLVKMAAEQNLTLGSDLGIVSFNDTVLKEVVAGGITTISTDFKLMGESLAGMIVEKRREKLANPASLIRRNSL
ncbi:GntR family transcriptional regulator [Gaoshiqia sediminis]|uniref:GntR family transcriptional regulator n=1 Tax=Gaoshiqia sediminis TaxID=2986998 RepID=A0AA41Y8P5_9BACT|nr:GntR family transcriptional regulator [Gaoshiqia sediminis]MCW0481255.1 GntR family transcriptional regulator [Gaoshiqia sediminis]